MVPGHHGAPYKEACSQTTFCCFRPARGEGKAKEGTYERGRGVGPATHTTLLSHTLPGTNHRRASASLLHLNHSAFVFCEARRGQTKRAPKNVVPGQHPAREQAAAGDVKPTHISPSQHLPLARAASHFGGEQRTAVASAANAAAAHNGISRRFDDDEERGSAEESICAV